MIQIRPAKPGEFDAEKALWRKAFGDDVCHLDWLFHGCCPLGSAMLLLEDDRLASVLMLLPMEIVIDRETTAHAEYIYAMATDPAQRKKGYGRQLLHYVDFHLRARGVDCAAVIPFGPGLHRFFESVDYREAFSLRKLELLRNMVESPGTGSAEPVEPEEYGSLRDRLLEDCPYVRYDLPLLRYQQEVCRRNRGGLYRVEVDGVTGCAAAEYINKDSLLLRELLIPRPQMAGAVAQLAACLPAARCHVRTPVLWDGLPGSYIQPYGMIKWYNRDMHSLWGESSQGFMGFSFE